MYSFFLRSPWSYLRKRLLPSLTIRAIPLLMISVLMSVGCVEGPTTSLTGIFSIRNKCAALHTPQRVVAFGLSSSVSFQKGSAWRYIHELSLTKRLFLLPDDLVPLPVRHSIPLHTSARRTDCCLDFSVCGGEKVRK